MSVGWQIFAALLLAFAAGLMLGYALRSYISRRRRRWRNRGYDRSMGLSPPAHADPADASADLAPLVPAQGGDPSSASLAAQKQH
jgi:hypothetical protein